MNIKRGLQCIPAICWTTLVFYLCLLPKSELPKITFLDRIYFDKVVHFGFYAIMFVFYLLALQPFRYKVVLSAVTCVIIGISVEFLQEYLPVNRSFDVWDIVANASGVCCSFVLMKSNKWKLVQRQL
ncbi:MAG: VanZ family protein [Chitinophagales bacterium]|nr:VanZ family protein [Chitinophagales bacterium]